MADLEEFRKMIRRYYRQTYREDGKTKHRQRDLADMVVMNEDELGKRLNGYRDEKTGRVWLLTEENVLDIVLVLAEWQALNGKQAVELLALMDYPLETSSAWKARLQKHFSFSELALFPMPKETPSAIVPAASQGGQLLQLPRRLFQACDLPKEYVPRPEAFNQIKRLLLTHEDNQTTAITTALRGAGGFGKTTLALALCHDPDIQAAFPDGILWVELGEHPPQPLDVLNGKLQVLEPSLSGALTLEEARQRWQNVLKERSYLLVIDDVWQTEALNELLKGGLRCGRLVTTRNDQLLPETAKRVWVDAMEPAEAMALLCQELVEDWQHTLEQSVLEHVVVQQLGCWPLLVSLARGMLKNQVKRLNKTPEQAFAQVKQAYEERGMATFHLGDRDERQRNVDACLEVNLRQLEEWVPPHYQARQRYLELAVFPAGADIPLATMQTYWQGTGGLHAWEVEDLCLRLADLSLLLPWGGEQRTIRLHEVVRSYLIQRAGSHLPTLHVCLLDACWQEYGLTRWADLPRGETYLWQHLILHLCQAGRREALQTTITDLMYLTRKALYVDVSDLEADLVLASTFPTTGTLESAPSFLVALHRSVVRIDHLLRQTQTEAEMGGLLLSHLGWESAFAAQRSTLERELPRPFLTAWHPLPEGSFSLVQRTLHGHSASVNSCAVSPDSCFIVSASSDHTLKVWDAATGTERFTLRQGEIVRGCAISKDGSYIVSASGNPSGEIPFASIGRSLNILIVWDVATGKERFTLRGHTYAVNSCAVSPDSRFIVSASNDHTFTLWDAKSGTEIGHRGHRSWVSSCAFSPDGRWIVSASHDHTLKVWDAVTGAEQHTFRGHTDQVNACVWSPDGRWIVSASHDHTLKVWDAATGAQLHTLEGHRDRVNGCAVDSDSRFIVSASDDQTLKVWDAATGEERLTLRGHSASVNSCAVDSDGRFIVSASDDQTLKIWDISTEERLSSSCGLTNRYNCRAVSRAGDFIVSTSDDGMLKVWDTITGEERFSLKGHTGYISGCAISQDGRFIVSAANDDALKVWDATTGKERFSLKGHASEVCDWGISPDGSFIVSASDKSTLKVWDATTSEERFSFHADYSRYQISLDGRFIVFLGFDPFRIYPPASTLKVWDATTGEERFSLETEDVSNCVISLDGSFIISVQGLFSESSLSSNSIALKVWDATTGEERFSFNGSMRWDSNCEISPDGSFIVFASVDGILKVCDALTGEERFSLETLDLDDTYSISPDGRFIISIHGFFRVDHPHRNYDPASILKVWDATTGEERVSFKDHIGQISSCAISPDGKFIVSASVDGILKVWDAATGHCLLTFPVGVALSGCTFHRDGTHLVAYSNLGMFFLRLVV